MNQNFDFMKEIADRVFKTKWITNRALTPFRLRCKIGDIMHCFTGLRTQNVRKLGDGIVVNKVVWKVSEIPGVDEVDKIKYHESPLPGLTWTEFYELDGFDSYDDFYNYFKSRDEKVFIAYEFIRLTRFRLEREENKQRTLDNWRIEEDGIIS